MKGKDNPGVPWHRSIRFKLVTTAIAVELCMLGVLLANSYRLVNDALESQTRARLEALAPLLNASLAGYVFQRDYSEIDAILKDLLESRFTEIRYIVVLDNHERILASVGTLDATRLPADSSEDRSVREALSDLVYDTRVPLTLPGNQLGSIRFGLSLAGMVSLRDTVLRQSLLIAAFEVILSLLLLSSGGYLITRHLTALLGATRRVAGGDYGSRITIGGKDEIGVLARDFNSMAAAVEGRVTELHASEEALRESDARFRSIFDNVSEAILVLDVGSGRIIDVNWRMCEMFGFTSQAEAIAAGFDKISAGPPPYSESEARVYLRKAVEVGPQTFEWHARNTRGELFWVEVSLRLSRIGEDSRLLAVVRDITERKKAESKINELAFYDPLTGLPNRTLLLDRLKQAMTASNRSETCGAVLFIDLDHFKTLNDSRGHDKGDLLLRQVAQRLTACVRDGDTVARLGGDEFVVVLESLNGNIQEAANQTENVCEKILAALGQTYRLGDIDHRSTASIGATLFYGHETSIDDLLKQADLAMYKAKDMGRNVLSFFDPVMQTVVMERVALEADLREAVQKRQFVLHYQAQVVGAGHVTGAEALVRWQHPGRGMVPPAEFIPLAEETGLILPLGGWVLEAACSQLALWASRSEMAHLTVAVNVSAQQFREADFVDSVLAVLRQTGANPRRLKLELTESLLVSNVQDIIEKMHALKAKGVGFSLDDFGTGYSSLSYLRRLPLDQLKIDKSFVRDVLSDPNNAAIAKTIVALAQSLGLGVIAEGVETATQRDFLANSGCNAYQGYFFSRPLPIAGFELFVQRV